jgi:hypothetical protein
MANVITQTQDLYRQVLLDPGTISDGTTAYIDMADVHSAKFFLALGATDQTTDMKLVQATSSGGAGVKDITDAAIATLAATDDNKQKSIEVDPYQLDMNNGFRYVAAVLVLAGGTGTTGYLEVQTVPKSRPVTAHADILEQVLLVG